LGGKGAGLTFVVYGAIIVLISRFQPGGVLTLVNRLWLKRTGKRMDAESASGIAHAP
jgi:branched-chain amino acid transport system permease protein